MYHNYLVTFIFTSGNQESIKVKTEMFKSEVFDLYTIYFKSRSKGRYITSEGEHYKIIDLEHVTCIKVEEIGNNG